MKFTILIFTLLVTLGGFAQSGGQVSPKISAWFAKVEKHRKKMSQAFDRLAKNGVKSKNELKSLFPLKSEAISLLKEFEKSTTLNMADWQYKARDHYRFALSSEVEFYKNIEFALETNTDLKVALDYIPLFTEAYGRGFDVVKENDSKEVASALPVSLQNLIKEMASNEAKVIAMIEGFKEKKRSLNQISTWIRKTANPEMKRLITKGQKLRTSLSQPNAKVVDDLTAFCELKVQARELFLSGHETSNQQEIQMAASLDDKAKFLFHQIGQ